MKEFIAKIKKPFCNASLHAFEDIGGRSDAHEVSGLILGQVRDDLVENVIHLFVCLSYGKTSDSVAVEIKLRDFLRVPDPDVGDDGALIDAEEELVRIDRVRQGV